MDKLIERLLNLFENKSISFSLRTSIFIISIFVITACDYYLNFSYDYHLSKKIEKLESIDKLKKIYKNDSIKMSKINELEIQIFNRKHYSDRLKNLDLSQINPFKESDILTIKKTEIKKDDINKNVKVRSSLWMILSSNYFFILIIIVLIILPFTNSVHRDVPNILGSIAGIIILIGIISLVTWIAYKIPLIYNRPYLNYILNFILHSPFLISIYAANKKSVYQAGT
ncbi:hypothetical protein [uncultured Tenacibaculum sp.]|uniref:hypothetical protein n=1 Tax=uncultured Tenacibaculum sp. TaxID=174713 RepID=UPI00261A7D22|nr:hypothetical protein [uncultured Tenacibaculum sp.]